MSEENWKIDLGTIEVERTQRALWNKGVLAPLWAQRFPELFREHDLELAKSQGPDGIHHIEWLAAIVLHHTTGYHCAGDYEFRPPNVAALLIKRTPGLRALIDDRAEHGACQGPDLLMYASDLTDWFFCEVKGPGDHLRDEQCTKFAAIAEPTGKRVRVLNFKWAPRRP